MEILHTACVGAGLIGSDWATLFSSKGYEVIIQDRSEELLEKAIGRIGSNLRFMEEHYLLGAGKVEESLAKIKTTIDIPEAVAKADYVQESVPDNYEIKKQVFREMDGAAPRSAILASSASGLLMSEIQPAVSAPERCILVHPMLPAHLLPTVEIAGGRATSPETVASTRSFMEKLGKIPVVLKKEVSGYIVNRLQAALMREAIDLVDKGVASPEDIDTAFCQGIGLRSPITGPFLRMHLAGEGIADFLANFMESYRYRWESMATWTTVPESAIKAVVEGTEHMDLVERKSLAEIRNWRDEMLVKLLCVMKEGRLE
jgi:3-hydroxypropionate dehydrogenase (NADP+)